MTEVGVKMTIIFVWLGRDIVCYRAAGECYSRLGCAIDAAAKGWYLVGNQWLKRPKFDCFATLSTYAAGGIISADCAVCKSNSAAGVAEYAASVSAVPSIVANVAPDFPEAAINHWGNIETKRVNIEHRIFRGAVYTPVASIVG